jgi:hypothetical protein
VIRAAQPSNERFSEMDLNGVIFQGLFAYALMAVIAVLSAFLVQGIVIGLERLQHAKKAPAAAPVAVAVTEAPPAVDETAHHVAAIAAAVFAVVGAHRLVYIGEVSPGEAWRITGRQLHQVSHLPKRAPQR